MGEPQRDPSPVSGSLYFADCRLDVTRGRLFRGGREIQLRPKAFEVLGHLARNAGRVVTKAELMDAVWRDTAVTDNSLVQCLLEIRRALDDEGQQIIRTVPRRGYLMEAAARIEPAAWPRKVDAPRRPSRHLRAWIAVLLVAAAGTATALVWRPAAAPDARSLAVLPFRSLGAEHSAAAFELGLTDALITRLSLARGLALRPWASVQLYIGSTKDPVQIGRELRVGSVLDGTSQEVDGRVRVTARLYRVADGRVLWSGTFDENVDDSFAVQDSISEKVASALYVELGEHARPRVPREAFEAYARGRYFFEMFTRDGNWKAVEYLNRATALAPDFALAHAAAALNYSPMIVREFIAPKEGMKKAASAAHRAMELDDALPEANLAMALAFCRDGNWASAERFFKRTIDLNPNYLHAWGFYSYFLHAMGRHAEGLDAARRALDLDPVSDYASKGYAQSLIWTGRYEEALEQATKAVELRPDFSPAQSVLATAYSRLNRLEDAHRHFLLADQKVFAALVRLAQGDAGPARSLAHDRAEQPGADISGAYLQAALGDTEAALAILESAAAALEYKPSTGALLYLAVDSRLEPLRREPRFRELVTRLNLPRNW